MKNKNTDLISISGTIESGKDTVAEMIQFIAGQNGAYVDFKTYDSCRCNFSDWHVKKFAGKLKEVASLLLGVPVDNFEDRKYKNSNLGEEWSTFSPGIYRWDKLIKDSEEYKMTVREFLQKLGTEGLRNSLHENVWVNALFADYHKQSKWIITDTRFPNELQSIEDQNGITIKLTRNQNVESKHSSESALDNAEFDYVIDNEGQSLEETFDEVVKMVERFNIK